MHCAQPLAVSKHVPCIQVVFTQTGYKFFISSLLFTLAKMRFIGYTPLAHELANINRPVHRLVKLVFKLVAQFMIIKIYATQSKEYSRPCLGCIHKKDSRIKQQNQIKDLIMDRFSKKNTTMVEQTSSIRLQTKIRRTLCGLLNAISMWTINCKKWLKKRLVNTWE